MVTDADKLIYQNSNKYRLHADNLRWTLLGGYAVFLAAIVGLSTHEQSTISLTEPPINFLAFILSFCYLWVLAVQNWFYNLFARWVSDCEYRLIRKIPLHSLDETAKIYGPSVSPYHPAFFLAEITVGSVAYHFLVNSIIDIGFQDSFISSINESQIPIIWLAGYILYFWILNLFFRNWQKLVYEGIIKKLSNLYKPIIEDPKS